MTTHARARAARIGLAYLAVNAAFLGLWATLAPRSFYDDFPGAGHHWVAVDGPYNHHLVSDVGALFVALAVVTVVAAVSLTPILVRTTAVAWVVSAGPHFLYHLGHRAGLPTADYVSSVGGLAFYVVVAVALLALAGPGRAAADPNTNQRVPDMAASQPSAASSPASSSGW